MQSLVALMAVRPHNRCPASRWKVICVRPAGFSCRKCRGWRVASVPTLRQGDPARRCQEALGRDSRCLTPPRLVPPTFDLDIRNHQVPRMLTHHRAQWLRELTIPSAVLAPIKIRETWKRGLAIQIWPADAVVAHLTQTATGFPHLSYRGSYMGRWLSKP